MGSGISRCNHTEIMCPEGYDTHKFNKILNLYDKLDINGNMVIEKEELSILATHHIKNQKKLLLKEQTTNEIDKQKKILSLILEFEKNKKKMEEEYQKKVEEETQKAKKNDKDIESKILSIGHLTKEQKYIIFKQKFTDSDNKLNFDLFFNYMKDKTDDIDNINWKLSGKLNDLRPQKEISVQINSPNTRPRAESP
jgi:hypothetical protein